MGCIAQAKLLRVWRAGLQPWTEAVTCPENSLTGKTPRVYEGFWWRGQVDGLAETDWFFPLNVLFLQVYIKQIHKYSSQIYIQHNRLAHRTERVQKRE